MTLEEAKQIVAKNHGYPNYLAGIFERNKPTCRYTVTELINEVAELYAKSKWEEACQLQINNCLNNLRPTFADSLAYGDVASAPNPQFVA